MLSASQANVLPVGAVIAYEGFPAFDNREDFVAICKGCGYSANLEKAVSVAKPPAVADPAGDLTPEEFHTPGHKTIAQVAAFTGLPETSQMKSLVMVAGGAPVLALVRGRFRLRVPARR